MMQILSYLLLGLVSGILGGALGVGGGTVMVPGMIMFFGMAQHKAQGTALAVMMMPVFIMSVYRYYVEGNVDLKMAVYVAIGLAIGALLGANVAQHIPAPTLRKIFAVFLVLVGIKMFLK